HIGTGVGTSQPPPPTPTPPAPPAPPAPPGTAPAAVIATRGVSATSLSPSAARSAVAARATLMGTWPSTARAGATLKLHLRLAVAATVKLKLLLGGKARTTTTLKLAAGTRTIRLALGHAHKALTPGRYTLVITTTAAGRSSTLSHVLRITRPRQLRSAA
ncbi:MAG: hypothetical protein QOE87_2322, partial [Gaiellales bacterium]|nr:hypothetical protein [Gaiellales bacterium]